MNLVFDDVRFTASDIKKLGGVSYRQLNDWDSKGALPNQREQSSGWRKFDPKRFFVILVCAEIRKQFGAPIEKLAWLQKFMLQDGADHFSAAVRMMKHGLAVLIFTDLSERFDMDADFAIGDSLRMGQCRDNEPQSYVLLLVNPLINKMLAALKNPARFEISDAPYKALEDAEALVRVHDTGELAVLELMRQPNTSKITITLTTNKEVVLESDSKADVGGTADSDPCRKVAKKVAREDIGVVAAKLNY